MGFVGKIEEKILAQQLRRKGLSYSQILLQVSVSKNTISRWCKDIPLTEDQKVVLLQSKELGQHKGSLVAAENKRQRRLDSISQALRNGKKEVGELTNRDLFMAGIALYAGEGYKDGSRCAFVNSDPKLISFMMKWFRLFLQIPESKFRGAIWIHEGLDLDKAQNYWSTLTGIPLTQFHRTYIARNKTNSPKIRKNIHPYGIFTICISDTAKHLQIMGWISATFPGKINFVL